MGEVPVSEAVHRLTPLIIAESAQQAARELKDKVELKDLGVDLGICHTLAKLKDQPQDDGSAVPSLVRAFTSTKPVPFDSDRSKDYVEVAGFKANYFFQIGCVFEVQMPGKQQPTPVGYFRKPVIGEPQFRNTQGFALLFAKSPLFRAVDTAQAQPVSEFLGRVSADPDAAQGEFVQEKRSYLARILYPDIKLVDTQLHITPFGVVTRDQVDEENGKYRYYTQYVFRVTIKGDDTFSGPIGILQGALGRYRQLRSLDWNENATNLFGDGSEMTNEMDGVVWEALAGNPSDMVFTSPSEKTAFRRGFRIL
jgi:hypothetical protein